MQRPTDISQIEAVVPPASLGYVRGSEVLRDQVHEPRPARLHVTGQIAAATTLAPLHQYTQKTSQTRTSSCLDRGNLIPRFLTSKVSSDQAIKAPAFNGTYFRMIAWSAGTEVPRTCETKGADEAMFDRAESVDEPCRQAAASRKPLDVPGRPRMQPTCGPITPWSRRPLGRTNPWSSYHRV